MPISFDAGGGGGETQEEKARRALLAQRAGERVAPSRQLAAQALATQRAGERAGSADLKRGNIYAQNTRITPVSEMREAAGTVPFAIPGGGAAVGAVKALSQGALATIREGLAATAARNAASAAAKIAPKVAPAVTVAAGRGADLLRQAQSKITDAGRRGQQAVSDALGRGYTQATVNPVGSAQQLYGRGAELVRQGAQGAVNAVRQAPQTAASLVGTYGAYSPAIPSLASPDVRNQLASGTGEFFGALTGRADPSAASTPSAAGPTYDASGRRQTPFNDAYFAEQDAARLGAGEGARDSRAALVGQGAQTGGIVAVPDQDQQQPAPDPRASLVQQGRGGNGQPAYVAPRDRQDQPTSTYPGATPEDGSRFESGDPRAETGRPEDRVGVEPVEIGDPGDQGRGVPDVGGGRGGTGQGGSNSPIDQLTQQLISDLGSIRSEIANSKSPDVQGIFMAQAQSLIDMLNKQESDLRAQHAKDGSEVDPATQFTIDQLRKRLTDDMKSVEEDLNRRGLFHSGILVEAQTMLREGTATSEGKILADRLNAMRDNLNKSLADISSKRFSTASQYGLAGIEGQLDADRDTQRRRDDLIGQVIGTQTDLRGQLSEEEDSRARLAEQTRQYNESFGMNKAQFNIEQGYKQQNDARERASRELIAQITTGGQNQRLEQELEAGKYQDAPQQPNATTVELATNTFIAQVAQAPDRQTALAAFQQALDDGTFKRSNADPAKILTAINAQFPEQSGLKWPWE